MSVTNYYSTYSDDIDLIEKFPNPIFADSKISVPREFYGLILSHLSYEDVCKIATVAKGAILNLDRLNRAYYRGHLDKNELRNWVKNHKQFICPSKISLDLPIPYSRPNDTQILSYLTVESPESKGTFQSRFPNLKILDVFNIEKNATVLKIAEFCPNLIKLRLYECDFSKDLSLETLTKLQELDMDFCPDITNLKLHPVNLEKLDLGYSPKLNTLSLKGASKLKELNLIESDINFLEIRKQSTNLANLMRLSTKHSGELSLTGLTSLKDILLTGEITKIELDEKATSLKKMNLSRIMDLNFDFLPYASGLEKLKLDRINSLTTEILSEIVACCAYLTDLYLGSCDGLSGALFLGKLPKLTNLDLNTLDNVTSLDLNQGGENLKSLGILRSANFTKLNLPYAPNLQKLHFIAIPLSIENLSETVKAAPDVEELILYIAADPSELSLVGLSKLKNVCLYCDKITHLTLDPAVANLKSLELRDLNSKMSFSHKLQTIEDLCCTEHFRALNNNRTQEEILKTLNLLGCRIKQFTQPEFRFPSQNQQQKGICSRLRSLCTIV